MQASKWYTYKQRVVLGIYNMFCISYKIYICTWIFITPMHRNSHHHNNRVFTIHMIILNTNESAHNKKKHNKSLHISTFPHIYIYIYKVDT